jgi:molybdate transport system substrate-binding protein
VERRLARDRPFGGTRRSRPKQDRLVNLPVRAARGDAELNFQQIIDWLHAPGVTYLGPLLAEVQNYTVWSAGVHASSPSPDTGRAFIKALGSPEASSSIKKTGMAPM